jgi:transcriptional repressor NrdR
MECYICNSATRVVNSRPQTKSRQVWRRRVCVNCDYIFTTVEKIDLEKSVAVELKNNSISSFQVERLLLSINDSLGHRKNHISESIALTNTIVAKLLSVNKSPLMKRDDIILTVLDVLGKFDKIASIHYKAYHPLDNL